MAAFFIVVGASFLSDHIRARGPVMAVGCLVAVGGYIMLLAAKENSVRYGGTFLVAVGVFPNSAMIMVSLPYCINGRNEGADRTTRAGCPITWRRTTSGPLESGS